MAAAPSHFSFKVKGQEGAIPSSGFGTATLHGEACYAAVRSAIAAGYRHIDSAMLYSNHEPVGRAVRDAIAAGEVTRAQLWVTTKVAFFPADADGANTWVPGVVTTWQPENTKATAPAGVDLALAELGLEYVDLLLIHNPCTDTRRVEGDYEASSFPHCFELAASRLRPDEREAVLARRLAAVAVDAAAAEASRAAAWRALEAARAAGKARFIGVSNYPPALVRAMAAYATVEPAVNQVEFHPRCAWPRLREHASAAGMALSAYGSGNSVALEKSPVVARVAAERGSTPLATVLRWTLQKGVAVHPRTGTPAHMAANLAAAAEPPLAPEHEAALDALNANWPYYWWAMPLLPKGAVPELEL